MLLCNLLIVSYKGTKNISFPQLFQSFSYTEFTLLLDNIAVNLRQLVQELHGQAPVLNDKFGQYAEIVEHEMWVNLLLQGVELGLHGKYLETLFLILGDDVGVQIMGVGVHTRYEGG